MNTEYDVNAHNKKKHFPVLLFNSKMVFAFFFSFIIIICVDTTSEKKTNKPKKNESNVPN